MCDTSPLASGRTRTGVDASRVSRVAGPGNARPGVPGDERHRSLTGNDTGVLSRVRFADDTGGDVPDTREEAPVNQTADDWIRLNVGAVRHPKLMRLPPEQRWSWLTLLCYSVEYETDGAVVDGIVPPDHIDALVSVGLLDRDGDGTTLHDFADYQMDHDRREEVRALTRERVRRHRERQDDVTRYATRDGTRLSSSSLSSSTSLVLKGKEAAMFDTFWGIYPRRVGKRKAAEAFARALRRAPAAAILAGAERLRDDPNREPEFTPHPTTWLNQDRWEDDPLPRRGGGKNASTLRKLDTIARSGR